MLATRTSRARVLTRCPNAFISIIAGRTRRITTHQDAEKGKGPLPSDVAGKEEHVYHLNIPKEKKLGKGYFITIACVVAALAAYKLEQSISGTEKNTITRLIDAYTEHEKEKEERNTLRATMLEQAGRDRTLLIDSKPSKVIPLRFPEQLNSGSPFNAEAGWSKRRL